MFARTTTGEIIRQNSRSNLHFTNAPLMSALPPKADIGTQPCNFRFVPKADMRRFIRSSRRGQNRQADAEN
jgi:hypothetical protein